MTLDDDSILSAYLDGELGPEQQQAVESALIADPQLAEEVRSLAALRDLVAALPRDVPADVTARVMRRVRRRALLGTARGIIAWGPVRAAGLVAIAAGLLLAVALPWLIHVGPGAAGGQARVEQQGPVENVRPVLSSARWPHFNPNRAHESRSEPPGPGGRRPSEAGSADRDGSAPGELSHVREYLDNPQLRRIFMVSDPGDGSAERRVASIVEQTTQFNYLRITVSQGIVIDPRHPDQATVFALVVGPGELHRLGAQLRTALKDRVQEADAEPAVVTQLADIGQVEALPPSPAAEMQIPREAVLSIKHRDPDGLDNAQEPPRAEPANPADGPTREQERSSPAAEVALPARATGAPVEPHPLRRAAGNLPPGRPPAAEDADQSLVVLVWVSRPRPG
jgi:hypothetical protein